MIEQQTAQLTPHAEARPNLDVRITREHIEDGVQDGMTDCPLALALTAAGDDELDVMRAEVAAGEIRLITRSRMDTRATTYHLSPTVRKWLSEFDAAPDDGDAAPEFTLVLDGPSQTARDARETRE